MASGFKLDLTQVILVGGGAAAIYYLYVNRLPPFDNLPIGGTDTGVDAVTDDEDDKELDVIPGKDALTVDFNKGGSSGDLEEDFFRVLARQKELLGDTPFSNSPRVVGDPALTGSPNPSSTVGGNITFDQFGNLVIVPVPNNALNLNSCQQTCKITCSNMYGNDIAKKEACQQGCDNVCGAFFYPSSSLGKARRSFSAKKRGYVSNHAMEINNSMPPDEIVGVHHRKEKLDARALIKSNMMLRPILSSRNQMKLRCGQSEVCNI